MKKTLLSLTAMLFATSAYSQFWNTQFTGFADDYRGISNIHAKDKNNVWAVAFDGFAGLEIQEFTKTSNGGSNWTAGMIELGDPSLNIQNIVGVNENTAWVMASREADGTGGVFKTSDGGESWEFQQGGTAGDSWNNWVHFFDENVGVFGSDPVGGYFELFRTTDGGTSWTRIPSANIPNILSGEWGYTSGYTYVGDAVFFYTNKGRIFKSTDKGLTWSIILPTGYVNDFGSAANNGLMAFSDANKGIVFRLSFSGTTPTSMAVYRTVNGGANWETVSASGINAQSRITSISYVPGTNTIVAAAVTSGAPGSFISYDNGSTWTQLDAEQHTSVKCIEDTCYSGGYSMAPSEGMFVSADALAVNDINKNKSISIYPNPVSNYFKIDNKGFDFKNMKVNVMDASGKIVKSFAASDSYDVSDLSKGVYVVTVTDGTITETKKIIKK